MTGGDWRLFWGGVGDCFEGDGFGGGCVGDTIVFSGVCGVSVLDLALLECG
jgi:hypothetical protein